MESPKRAQRPVESFGPELFAALLQSATRKLELRMPYSTAVRFRLRIHQLRSAMRATQHDRYALCSRVKVSIKWPSETQLEKSGRYFVPTNRSTECLVTLEPNDAEFGPALKSIGVDPLSGILNTNNEPLKTDLENLLDALK